MTPPSEDERAAWNDGLKYLMNQVHEDGMKWFPASQTIPFLTLALVGETGEVANIVKKAMRGSMEMDDAIHGGVRFDGPLPEEVIDVLIYLLSLMAASEFKGINWMNIWYRKRAFNEARFGGYRAFDEGDIK